MVITPPKRYPKKFRPVALLTPGHRTATFETIEGSRRVSARGIPDALEALKGHAVYCDGGLTKLRFATDARDWQGETWKGKTVSMTMKGSGVKIRSLRGILEGSQDRFGDLLTAVGWFNRHGVNAAGISSMGWALWRTTLRRDFVVHSKEKIGRGCFYGGRQQCPTPREYQHMAAVDIAGAYPFEMTSRPYALELRRVAKTTELDPTVPGVVRATVIIPDWIAFGPIPERIDDSVIRFPTQGGPLRGYWTWEEAFTATNFGADVTIEECWAPETLGNLFGPEWLAVLDDGKHLVGPAGRFVKAAANATWGMFAMKGDHRGIVTWEDVYGRRPIHVETAPQRLPHASTCHVASETASRVRTRVLREGLYGDWSFPVQVDTDGIIVRASRVRGLPTTAPMGQWRIKQTMRRVDLRHAQLYRYQCGKGCGVTHPKWHYVAAGAPSSLARGIFERRQTFVGGLLSDIVLPSGHTSDTELLHDSQADVVAAGGSWE